MWSGVGEIVVVVVGYLIGRCNDSSVLRPCVCDNASVTMWTRLEGSLLLLPIFSVAVTIRRCRDWVRMFLLTVSSDVGVVVA